MQTNTPKVGIISGFLGLIWLSLISCYVFSPKTSCKNFLQDRITIQTRNDGTFVSILTPKTIQL